MVPVQTECSKLERRFVIKFLGGEKSRLCEIYWIMYNVNGEECFNQKTLQIV